MKSPKNLSHKPIISVNDYDKIDAQYRPNTDAVALSIGFAQYQPKEISLKVWRRSGEKWSRQSEELPLHRNIDLNILLLGALLTDIHSGFPMTNLREEVDQESNVQKIKEYYSKHEKFLKPRLEELYAKLGEFLNK